MKPFGSDPNAESRPVGLLRHSFDFIPADEDQLRTVDVVTLEGDAVPAGRLRSRRKSGSRHIVRRAGSGRAGVASISVCGFCTAITLPEPNIIRAMLSHNRKADVGAEVELPDEAFAAEALVADSGTGNGYPTARSQVVG